MSALCRHFGPCGGCEFQDVPPQEYRAAKRQAVAAALARHGMEAEIADLLSVPPHSRRRATFKVARRKDETTIGFHARQSHDIVDMRECRLLTPTLFASVATLRTMMGELLKNGEEAELHVTDTETGLDIALAWKRRLTSDLVRALASWAPRLKAARILVGRDIAVETARPMVRFGKAQVPLPPRAFLQPTRDGEAMLQNLVAQALPKAKQIADLFAGCGTFTFPLAERMRVHAVELDGASLDAVGEAARHTQGLKPVTTEKRDLFKLPLTPPELKRFDAVLLDPPRAGALAQVREIAASAVQRAVYVSCNPETFARDARVLADAGFALGPVAPVDQFLWSSHTELVAGFARR